MQPIVFLQKCVVAFGLFVSVYITLRLSPVPRKIYESCDRPCHDLQYPMICRVTLTIDNNSCTSGRSSDFEKSAKNLKPGPTIHVCQNDVVFVNVINTLEDHFQFQWQDKHSKEGLVVNRSNNSYVQYKFRAINPGMHIWGAKSKNSPKHLSGALVVRKLPKSNEERRFYDHDKRDHTMFISECGLKPIEHKLLINGKGNFGKSDLYIVRKNNNYRFRVGFSGNTDCSIDLRIENHTFKLIEVNGQFENLRVIDHFLISNGTRLDFVLDANQRPGNYRIKLVQLCKKRAVKSFIAGTLKYDNPEEFTCQKFTEYADSVKFGKSVVNS